MSVKRYKKSNFVEAIQFISTNDEHIQEIIKFVGLPISVEYKGFKDNGEMDIELRVIRGSLHVPIAQLNDYIVKYPDGILDSIAPEEFDYEEADET